MPTKCRHSDPLVERGSYIRGSYSEAGSYMLVDTVVVVAFKPLDLRV
jgi:hypothetical protein